MSAEHRAYQAAFDPTPRWKRRLRDWRGEIQFRMGSPWRRFCYRPFSRLIHRFGLHHAPPNHALTNDAGWPLHRCNWCGLSGFVRPPLTSEEKAQILSGKVPAVTGIKRGTPTPKDSP